MSARVRETMVYRGWRAAVSMLLGIHPHAVFMDSRFAPFPWQLAIIHVDTRGAETWLPIASPEGHPGPYATGRQNVYWMHRLGAAGLRSGRVEDAIRRLTAFWAHRHAVDLRDATFAVRLRRLLPAHGWAPGLLRRQHEQPWVTIGTAVWSDERFTLTFASPPDASEGE